MHDRMFRHDKCRARGRIAIKLAAICAGRETTSQPRQPCQMDYVRVVEVGTANAF